MTFPSSDLTTGYPVTHDRSPLKICLIVGEASGDALGAPLMAALVAEVRQRYPGRVITFCGVGGDLMAREGLESFFPASDLAVMGLVEIIPHIPRILNRLAVAERLIQAEKPHVVVTIDAPGFAFRLARRLRRRSLDIPMIHYTAPTVWAWRSGRAAKIAGLYDHLLCLFPFEPPYFTRWGLDATYVGHPLLERIPYTPPRPLNGDGQRTLCLLPGSRTGEIKILLPTFLKAAGRIAVSNPNLQIRFVLPTLPHLKGLVDDLVYQAQLPFVIEVETDPEQGRKLMAQSTAALAASGTVSLELALLGVPMVVAYRVSSMTAMVMKRLLKTRYVSLVNILQNQPIVPECLQERCTPDVLVQSLLPLLYDGQGRSRQLTGLSNLYRGLTESMGGDLKNPPSPSRRAAGILLSHADRAGFPMDQGKG